eukprot:4911703-Amphidinium_carterae.1
MPLASAARAQRTVLAARTGKEGADAFGRQGQQIPLVWYGRSERSCLSRQRLGYMEDDSEVIDILRRSQFLYKVLGRIPLGSKQ